MNLSYQIIDVPGYGFGYKISSADGSVSINQPFKPGVPGRVGMTRAVAEEYALAEIAEIEAAAAAAAEPQA